MCKTTTNQTAQSTPDRVLRILQRIDQTGRGAIRITERISRNKVETKIYQVTTFPAYGGEAIGITFGQEDGTIYNTCLDGKKSTCECKGFLRWHKPCRHILAGFKMKELGELHLPMTQDNDDEVEHLAHVDRYEECFGPADCY